MCICFRSGDRKSQIAMWHPNYPLRQNLTTPNKTTLVVLESKTDKQPAGNVRAQTPGLICTLTDYAL